MITRIFAAISGVGLFSSPSCSISRRGSPQDAIGVLCVIGWSAYVVIMMIFVVVLGAIGIMLTVWALYPTTCVTWFSRSQP